MVTVIPSWELITRSLFDKLPSDLCNMVIEYYGQYRFITLNCVFYLMEEAYEYAQGNFEKSQTMQYINVFDKQDQLIDRWEGGGCECSWKQVYICKHHC